MRRIGLVALLALVLAGCDNIDRQTGDRVLIGTGTGATVGAIVGAAGSGTLWGGLAIGAAAGAAGSFVADQIAKSRE
jgi:hypothetical protein